MLSSYYLILKPLVTVKFAWCRSRAHQILQPSKPITFSLWYIDIDIYIYIPFRRHHKEVAYHRPVSCRLAWSRSKKKRKKAPSWDPVGDAGSVIARSDSVGSTSTCCSCIIPITRRSETLRWALCVPPRCLPGSWDVSWWGKI